MKTYLAFYDGGLLNKFNTMLKEIKMKMHIKLKARDGVQKFSLIRKPQSN